MIVTTIMRTMTKPMEMNKLQKIYLICILNVGVMMLVRHYPQAMKMETAEMVVVMGGEEATEIVMEAMIEEDYKVGEAAEVVDEEEVEMRMAMPEEEEAATAMVEEEVAEDAEDLNALMYKSQVPTNIQMKTIV